MERIESPDTQIGAEQAAELLSPAVDKSRARNAGVVTTPRRSSRGESNRSRKKSAKQATANMRTHARGGRTKTPASRDEPVDLVEKSTEQTSNTKARRPPPSPPGEEPTTQTERDSRPAEPGKREPPVPPLSRDAAPDVRRSLGWRTRIKAQRRVLLGTSLGFLAGLLVYASLGPDETPDPDKRTAGSDAQPTVSRSDGRLRPSHTGPVRSSREGRQTTIRGYQPPPIGAEPYPWGTRYVPEPYRGQGYSDTAEGAPPSTAEYSAPDAYAAPYRAESWQSTYHWTPQSTFAQPFVGEERQVERPWGETKTQKTEPRQARREYPTYPYGTYPPVGGYPSTGYR